MSLKRIPHQAVSPVGFTKKGQWLRPDSEKLQYISAPTYSPKRHRVKFMYRVKARLLKWGIGVLASIPEEMIWQFLSEIVARIEERIDRLPKWARAVVLFLSELLKTLDPDSPGGMRITKAELFMLLNMIWDEINELPDQPITTTKQ